jgi:hypothetical protein
MEERKLLGGEFFYVMKGQTFNKYSEEFIHNTVMKYVNGSKSYKVLAEVGESVTAASLKCDKK